MRGGCTLLINPATSMVRYAITKHILSGGRLHGHRSFLKGEDTSLRAIYLDNSSAGYASQRHIVAGIVSNQRMSLRVFTGFDLGSKLIRVARDKVLLTVMQSDPLFVSSTLQKAIAMTLGLPRLPESWSNDQVLGFIRFMWQQWLLKSGRGTAPADDGERGPAPPAAVAAAAKIAFSALGSSPTELFQTELHEKPLAEQPPVDKAAVALLERSESGTMHVPVFSETEGDLSEWTDISSRPARTSSLIQTSASTVRSPLENPERRNRNLHWLRLHFRSLGDIGRLPFNNADLWQLHQYYFSPPYPIAGETENSNNGEIGKLDSNNTPMTDTPVPPPAPVPENALGVSRAISFQALGDAFALSGCHNNKRPPDDDSSSEDAKPAAKRAKNLKPRIAYYPRIMVRPRHAWGFDRSS